MVSLWNRVPEVKNVTVGLRMYSSRDIESLLVHAKVQGAGNTHVHESAIGVFFTLFISFHDMTTKVYRGMKVRLCIVTRATVFYNRRRMHLILT